MSVLALEASCDGCELYYSAEIATDRVIDIVQVDRDSYGRHSG